MVIGLLAYHAACNFGANLQLLSTFENIKKQGHDPVVINWVPEDLNIYYVSRTKPVQYDVHKAFREKYLEMTGRCETENDILREIEKYGIEAIIIGSDALLQHHSKLENIRPSLRKLFYFYKPTSDRLYPNPFWGSFMDDSRTIPSALMSVSSQDSRYQLFSRELKQQMKKSLQRFRYISVRDDWTQKMVMNITGDAIKPDVTPDPLFAFNQNAGHLVPSKDELLKKFGLSDNYILFSFLDNNTVDKEWLIRVDEIAKNKGYQCVALPFPHGLLFKSPFERNIDIPLSPMDWYALIKYSKGYVGHNMHPIVVSLHNAVPFYSFDNYGVVRLNGLIANEKSSKIYHLLKKAGFSEFRTPTIKRNFAVPAPEKVMNSLMTFDTGKEKEFSQFYYGQYQSMMENILKSIIL